MSKKLRTNIAELQLINLINKEDFEVFKILRAKLSGMLTKETGHLIALTASKYQEGNTLCSVLLSAAFAQLKDKKTLLVECNLRQPEIDRFLSLTAKPGLSDYLRGELTVQDITHAVPDLGLSVICAGTPASDSSELLASEKFQALLQELKGSYDYVFLDLPAVLEVSDALCVIPHTDGVVMVVNDKRFSLSKLKAGLERIKDVQGNVLGLVMNETKRSVY